MKKVGIITMHRVPNYGSVLQTYATYHKVLQLGYIPEIIDYQYPDCYHADYATGNENKSIVKKSIIKMCIKSVLRCIGLLGIARVIVGFRTKRHCDIFFRFVNRMILSPKYTKESILRNPPTYDIYLTGSDQTWNPRYLHHDYSFLLNFAPESTRKISYAASFGSSAIGDEFKKEYSRLLKRYNSISVREASGVKVVRELAARPASHVLDPTMLLSADEWKKEIVQKSKFPKKFIFCYCMNYVFDPFPQMLELLHHLSAVMNMPVLFWGGRQYWDVVKDSNIEVVYGFGPEEFLEIYDKASFVVTNSFHGVAFAINFQKDFFAVLNPNPTTTDDRVKDCLTTFDLENRGLNLAEININDIKIQNIPTDHSESQKRLNKLRDDSISYLAHALKGDDHAE